MDCLENRKFCTRTCSQHHKDNDSKDTPVDCRNRISSKNLNVSIGCQVNEADKPLKQLQRKRKLLLDSEDEEENVDDDEEKNKSNNMKSRRNTKPLKQVVPGKKTVWNWVAYMEEERMPAAHVKLFKEYQSFPQSRNGFKVGMKLEGLDPAHPSLFCVLTIAEVQGYRMRLHFDGYSEYYDFWVNADSPDIHPVGWCEKTGHKLLSPKGYKEGEFNWALYLKNCKAQAAPKNLFKTFSTPVTPSGFRVGMKLEAVDKKNPSLMCVATITDMLDNRLLIHFDNWNENYDYWCDASSPYIRPVGYCQETGTLLTTPPEYKDSKSFSWEKYLEETSSQAAPARAFKLRPAHGFQVNTKLEAVDKRNPMLIRVATIAEKDDHRIKIHFDGWDHSYDFWVDADSPDLHPVGWCAKTGHALQLPLGAADMMGVAGQGCPTPGCQGIGHVRGYRYGTHYTLVGCPYSEANLNRESSLHDRLSGERPSPNTGVQKSKRPVMPAPFVGPREDSPQSRKSSTRDSERSRRSSVHSLSEQSENSQEKDWMEDESSADTNANPKKIGCRNLQLVMQEDDGKDTEFTLQQALHQSVFMPSLSSSPTHRLHLCWEQHCRLLPEVSGLTARSVAKWTVEEVANFVQRLPGCKEQASVFREEQIDGEAFLLLNQADIVKILSIKLGPALKIYNAILMFKSAEED
nr:lethal(3)malignant brain tumor-like protein 3 isoform X1 [Pelodiscus sinensis]XP_006112071.1 lethal(3)malignant brain tumor-like protein 3 isoform X1 [Pelodiscus sinensis]XP_006112073.1 lethal(3)malignant brain tumor-like protein 3 isoform X1 [Pelodiscus sinensis]XP_025043592.1 lethal(3)malignant brain tumor-like protein 3 isoform X1 [Pelodiscus sinensis]XP_025043596.1 lethal(3)malignant brain tumor-like protein 3 isoform X1 [Pelodiscus sinensis]|eukprot:XP_006112070.1 lethal(3)malignant brain tumor-like protein 3 isoform X1 [Pelodiscus sinensis]